MVTIDLAALGSGFHPQPPRTEPEDVPAVPGSLVHASAGYRAQWDRTGQFDPMEALDVANERPCGCLRGAEHGPMCDGTPDKEP